MDFLVVGLSNIVTRRVIPALLGLPAVERIHLASQRAIDSSFVPSEKRGQVFLGYDRALAECPRGIAYVSLPNSMHALWARRALEAGFHVIVDKPACTTLADVTDLVSLAAQERRCLAEATVWSYHPLFDAVRCLLTTLDEKITRLTATFSFPALPKENFRNNPQLGGGAFLDLAPYAASCSRYFFADPAKEVVGRFLARDEECGLETSFSLLATFPGARAMVGHFGFTTEYKNAVSILGKGISVDIDRAFTTPPSLVPTIHWKRNNCAVTLICPAGDSFAFFLEAVIAAVQSRRWQHLADFMVQDALFLDRLRTTAEQSNDH